MLDFLINKLISNYLVINPSETITYLSSDILCPTDDAMQSIQSWEPKLNRVSLNLKPDPGGFCAAWSFYYLEIRLLNPDIDTTTLITLLNEDLRRYDLNGENNFTNVIRGYHQYINHYIENEKT